MSGRVYPPHFFEKEVARYQGKIHCPNCYSMDTFRAVSYFPYIESEKSGSSYCMRCRKNHKNLDLLSKEEVRNKKIDEVLEK